MPSAEHRLNVLSGDSAVFISDIHLSDHTPQLIARFEACCHAVDTQWLIVMGDLFEAYCGDDDRSASIAAVEQAFICLHARGVRVALMQGNRDFLIGAAFAQRCHALLLADPCVWNGQWLLSHGDEWCTLDTVYQTFRASSRSTAWQQQFLSQPLALRQAQVQAYRSQSKAAQMDLASETTDVVDTAVLASAAQHGCTAVLHGHTHRPSERTLQSAEQTMSPCTIRKVVLGDWDESGAKPAQCARYRAGQLRTFLF